MRKRRKAGGYTPKPTYRRQFERRNSSSHSPLFVLCVPVPLWFPSYVFAYYRRSFQEECPNFSATIARARSISAAASGRRSNSSPSLAWSVGSQARSSSAREPDTSTLLDALEFGGLGRGLQQNAAVLQNRAATSCGAAGNLGVAYEHVPHGPPLEAEEWFFARRQSGGRAINLGRDAEHRQRFDQRCMCG